MPPPSSQTTPNPISARWPTPSSAWTADSSRRRSRCEITSATPGAAIYYSFNGNEPGPGKGLLYTGPITITNTTVVRARAFKDG